MICLCLTAPTLEENTLLISQNRPYIDLVELRADLLDEQFQCWNEIEQWAKVQSQIVPILFTVRIKEDMGSWNQSETVRHSLLLQAIQSKYIAWVDIEYSIKNISEYTLAQVIAQADEHHTRIVLSKHFVIPQDATTLPSHWEDELLQVAQEHPSALVKTALSCNSTDMLCDIFEKSQILQQRIPNRFILASMGVLGIAGRILTRYTHSLWTYTSHGKTLQSLKQTSPTMLVDLYQFRHITPDTQLYAIVGNPVLHSQSPHLHNALFREAGVQKSNGISPNKVYIHLPVDNCQSLRKLSALLPFAGLSITLPFKKEVVQYLDTMDPLVEASQSCNTIIIKDNTWHGYNTDIPGFLTPLEQRLKKNNQTLKGAKATIIGAGGSSQALAFALLQAQASILIVNRTEANTKALIVALQNMFPHQSNPLPINHTNLQDYDAISEYSDIIIQTSSVGMDDIHASPIPEYPFQGTEIVYDIIYTPPITKLLQDAQNAGCTIISGKEMFEAQGKLQSALFLAQ